MKHHTQDMRRIISVSRRTDVPAFYTDWFANRLDAGFAGWENPFGGQKYVVSLRVEDVIAFVFWSKNYRPFLKILPRLQAEGHKCLFQYTITGLPHIMEAGLVDTDDAIESFQQLSSAFSSAQVFWRYDPIVISDVTDSTYHLARFEYIAGRLAGYTHRCYLSYAILYGKVEKNFRSFTQQHGIEFRDPSVSQKIELANKLAEIGRGYGIQVYTCCGDYLIGDSIHKAHCVDDELISRIFYNGTWHGKRKPTRKECGCAESTDIGKYDTCPHGCIYCYANVNKHKAMDKYRQHDTASPFLGYSSSEGQKFLGSIKDTSIKGIYEGKEPRQMTFEGF